MQYAIYREPFEVRFDTSLVGNNTSNFINNNGTIYDPDRLCRDDNILLCEKNDVYSGFKKIEHLSFDDKVNVNIYRFKFSEDFVEELYKFSKIHQYEERKHFKESWEIWVEENKDLVDYEINRLKKIGYDGDIIDKMYKSARYYFRKKGTEKKAPVERREYIHVSKELKELVKTYI